MHAVDTPLHQMMKMPSGNLIFQGPNLTTQGTTGLIPDSYGPQLPAHSVPSSEGASPISEPMPAAEMLQPNPESENLSGTGGLY
jgi:hypothetical protein